MVWRVVDVGAGSVVVVACGDDRVGMLSRERESKDRVSHLLLMKMGISVALVMGSCGSWMVSVRRGPWRWMEPLVTSPVGSEDGWVRWTERTVVGCWASFQSWWNGLGQLMMPSREAHDQDGARQVLGFFGWRTRQRRSSKRLVDQRPA